MSPRWGRWEAVGLAAVFCLAVGMRLAVIHDLRGLPSMQVLVEDAAAYDAMAHRLLDRGGLPAAAFYQDPLYPYFLAACYATFGDSFATVRVAQALAGGATAVLLALAGWQLAGGRDGGARLAGAIAGLLAALYAPLLFYAPLLLKETLLVLLASAFAVAALAALDTTGGGWAALAGLCLGAASLLRGNLLLLAPLAAAGIGVLAPRREGWRSRAGGRAAALFLTGFVLALAPIVWVNHRVSGEWILTTSQSGANFYLGNRQGASGLYEPLRAGRQTPADEQEDARRMAVEILEGERGATVAPQSLSATEVSRALWRQSWREIAAAPGAWLARLGRKLVYVWNGAEIPDAEGFDVYREESPWLRRAPATFGWIAPLGLAGLVVLWRRPAGRLLALLVVGSSCFVALFFVFARYRLVLVPLLVPAAGAGLVELVACWRRRELGRVAAWAAAAAAALVLVHWQAFGAADRAAWAAVTHGNLATAANALGAGLAATDPEQALAWYTEAERRGRTALAAAPDHLPARLPLVVAALRRGQLHQARGERDAARGAYDAAQRELTALLTSPTREAYPELVDNASLRLGRALASARAALEAEGSGPAPP